MNVDMHSTCVYRIFVYKWFDCKTEFA